nr:outer membrane protein assembly factor BamD [Polaribacter batillariae]
MQAFDNLLEDYLGTAFKEEALYYRFKAANDFVFKSTDRRKSERIKNAIDAYEKLLRSFPETTYLEDANEMLAKLQKEKTRIDALIAQMKKLEDTQKGK